MMVDALDTAGSRDLYEPQRGDMTLVRGEATG